MQYWRSTDHVYRYASPADARHLPAWKTFNAVARKHPGAVGIWHETFAVPASGIETLYGNGAVMGLGAATGTIEATRRGEGSPRAPRIAGVRGPGRPTRVTPHLLADIRDALTSPSRWFLRKPLRGARESLGPSAARMQRSLSIRR